MSGGFDAIIEIGASALENVSSFFPADLGSVVTDFGKEFMSALPNIDAFQVPVADVANLGGVSQVGSLAGNASWFDSFNFGSILDSIPSVSDFNLGSLTDSLPSLSSIKDVANTFTTDFGGFIKDAQGAIKAYQQIAPAVNAVSSALGIQNPINQIIQPVSSALNLAGGVAAASTSVSRAIDGIGTTASKVTSLFASDPNSTNARDVATGLPINTPREISDDPFEAERLAAEARNNEVGPTEAAFISLDDDPFEQARLDAEARNNEVGPTQAAVVDQLGLVDRISLSANQFVSDFKGFVNEYPGIARTASQITGIPIIAPGSTTDPYGLNLLSDADTNAMIARNTLPGFVNTFTNPGATGTSGLPAGVTSQYTSVYDPETRKWSVFDNITGTTVQSGLTEQAAILAEQDLNITSGITLTSPEPVATTDLGEIVITAPRLTTANTTVGTPVSNLVAEARKQQTLRNLTQTKAQSTDWRVKLRLAPNSTYLYNDPTDPGILSPLSAKSGTDGVIFPYTPAIETAYKANYDQYDLTHSNYRGYFYKNSYVDVINMRCTFTAQDTSEANYLLAVIHFFRSVTKMFYGQDSQRGSPPPLVFLSGLGNYQFNEHPCVVSQFNYTLPPDVDYVRAYSMLDMSTDLLANRTRTSISGNPLSYGINRLLTSGLFSGAIPTTKAPSNLEGKEPTYVPTKMEISISLLPIQGRQQVSTQFSLKGFANGNLLKGGFW